MRRVNLSQLPLPIPHAFTLSLFVALADACYIEIGMEGAADRSSAKKETKK